MAKIKLSDYVTRDEDGSFRAVCPVTDPADQCGNPAAGERFTSVGWDSEKTAMARLRQHIAAHNGEKMPSLEEFRAEHGLLAHADGVHVVKAGDLL